QTSLTLQEPEGHRYHAETASSAFRPGAIGGPGPLVVDFWNPMQQTLPSQLMMIDKPLLDRIKTQYVTMDASALATFFRLSDTTWTSVGHSVSVPAAGKCGARIAGDNPTFQSFVL